MARRSNLLLVRSIAGYPRVLSLVPGVTANRLPGLQSSKQNLEQENEVYDGMMLDVIRLLVLPPLTGCSPEPGLFEVGACRQQLIPHFS